MKLSKAISTKRIKIESEHQSTWFDDYYPDRYGGIVLISCGEIISEIKMQGVAEFLSRIKAL
jgi:hypothetical protein